MKKKIIIGVICLILLAVVIICQSLSILSMAIFIAAAGYAFLNKDEAAETRRMPWQSIVLAILALLIYLFDWMILGN
jgi:predicted membrane protein